MDRARRRYRRDNLDFSVGSVTNIPLPSASVDVVVSFEMSTALKEQVVHGRVFETVDDLRAFIDRYNAEWLIEKNACLSPHAQRRQHKLATMPMAA